VIVVDPRDQIRQMGKVAHVELERKDLQIDFKS
jgi:hypothetical protein